MELEQPSPSQVTEVNNAIPASKPHDKFFGLVVIIAILLGIILPYITWRWAEHLQSVYNPNYYVGTFDWLGQGISVYIFIIWVIAIAILAILGKMVSKTNDYSLFVKYGVFLGGTLGLLSITLSDYMTIWLHMESSFLGVGLFFFPFYVASYCTTGLAVGVLAGKLLEFLLKKRQRVLSVALVVLGIIFYGGILAKATNFGHFDVPDKPQVKTQQLTLKKGQFLQSSKDVNDLIGGLGPMSWQTCQGANKVTTSPSGTNNLAFTGSKGIAFYSTEGTLLSTTNFTLTKDDYYGTVIPIDSNNDGTCEFVRNNGGAFGPVGLLDSQGSVVWRYGKQQPYTDTTKLIPADGSPLDIIPFDTDDDGKLDFIIPLLIGTDKKTDILRADGTRLQRLDANLTDSQTADINKNGKLELVTLEEQGASDNYDLTIRNNKLAVLNKFPLHLTNNVNGQVAFRLKQWPDSNGDWYAFINDTNATKMVNLKTGETIQNHLDYNGVAIRFTPSSPAYWASLHGNGNKQGQVLSLYKQDTGELVYDEILPSGTGGDMTVLPDNGENTLLVTGECQAVCTIWRYKLPTQITRSNFTPISSNSTPPWVAYSFDQGATGPDYAPFTVMMPPDATQISNNNAFYSAAFVFPDHSSVEIFAHPSSFTPTDAYVRSRYLVPSSCEISEQATTFADFSGSKFSIASKCHWEPGSDKISYAYFLKTSEGIVEIAPDLYEAHTKPIKAETYLESTAKTVHILLGK